MGLGGEHVADYDSQDLDEAVTEPVVRLASADPSVPVAVPDPTRPDVPKVVLTAAVERHLASLAFDESWGAEAVAPSRWPASTSAPPVERRRATTQRPRARSEHDAVDVTTRFYR